MTKKENIKVLYEKLKRGDLALIARELGIAKQSVLSVVNGRFWNEGVYEAIKIVANKRDAELAEGLERIKEELENQAVSESK